MHLYKLVIILLIQYVGLNLAVRVCFPDTFEGQSHRTGTKKATFFAYDFTAQRFYEAANDDASDRSMFFLTDLASGHKFTFKGEDCRAESIENEMVFDQCIDNDFKLSALSLGELNNGIDVRTIDFMVHNVDIKLFVTKANDGYFLPFFKKEIDRNNQTSTSFYSELTDSISERSNPLYTDVTNCVHEE